MNYPKFIILCIGDQGLSIIEKNYLQIHIHLLQRINREQILRYYINSYNLEQKPINLVTTNKSRSFYIDTLLAKNYDLINKQTAQLQTVTQKLFQFPLQLQVIFPNDAFKIQSSTVVKLDHFNFIQKMGQGTFAEIFIGQQKYNKQLVIIKKINKYEQSQQGQKQMIYNQFAALKHRHFHKVNLNYMIQTTNDIYFIMDYCPAGDLYQLIQKQKDLTTHKHSIQCSQCQVLQKQQKYWVWLQVAIIIVYFHQNNSIYRDLKPENILIDQRGFVKLCDFGYCKKYNHEQHQLLHEICGTLEYIPPELVLKQGYDKGIDLYGLGILLYQLIANKSPFSKINFTNMKQKKISKINFDKWIFTPLQKDLILKLTSIKSSQRLGYKNSKLIFKHQFFNQKQVLSLVKKIVQRKPNPYFLARLKFFKVVIDIEDQKQLNQLIKKPKVLNSYEEYQQNPKYFQKLGYNYLTTTYEIQEKVGPKFCSNY